MATTGCAIDDDVDVAHHANLIKNTADPSIIHAEEEAKRKTEEEAKRKAEEEAKRKEAERLEKERQEAEAKQKAKLPLIKLTRLAKPLVMLTAP
ncbi:MAG: hypothetical protein Q4D68_03330 [Moraxella equi]|nr:hypothetical protein [Moraxella equi]